MKNEDQFYMNIAHEVSRQSYAEKMQVGSVIVKNNRIISIGYNGTPTGWDNNCEYIIEHEMGIAEHSEDTYIRKELKTKPEVLHAETNAIAKVAQSSESSKGATLYTTCAPCLQCAKLIYQSGIRRVVFKDEYRERDGLDFLSRAGLDIKQQDKET